MLGDYRGGEQANEGYAKENGGMERGRPEETKRAEESLGVEAKGSRERRGSTAEHRGLRKRLGAGCASGWERGRK